jgi:DNA-binding beta-propeller fold protein YncE
LEQATVKLLWIALLSAIIMSGCGTPNNSGTVSNGDTTGQTTFNNGSGNQPFKPLTHLLHRSLVSNYFAGALDVVDATENRLTAFTIPVGAEPTYLQPSPDGSLTLVNNTGSDTLSSFNNFLEAVKATIQLGGFTESFVTSVNNKAGFAAVPNYSNGNFATPGAIVRFNPTDGSLNTAIPFPNVRYLAMDPAEKHLLAFTDVDDDAHWVDLTKIDPTTQVPVVTDLNSLPLPASSLPAGTLSRPVAAFFSSDSTKAFILSCGTECGGGSQASVTEIDVSNDAANPTVVKQLLVNGARRGLIDLTANKLYVAGSMTTSTAIDCPFPEIVNSTCTSANSGGNNVQDGWFTVIDLNAATVLIPISIGNGPIRIGNGVKRWIRNIHGTFWVASLNCGVESCVSLVNPTAGTANVLPTANGDATGISLTAVHANSKDDVYTIEGGELFIYDQQGTLVPPTTFPTDVKGQASDVIYIN